SAHDDQTVEVQTVICVKHGGHEVVALVVHYGFAGDVSLARGAEYGAALGQNAGEVLLLHELVVALDEAFVAVVHAVYLDVGYILEQRLAHAAYGGVEALAVSARGHNADFGVSLHAVKPPLHVLRTYLINQMYHTISGVNCQQY